MKKTPVAVIGFVRSDVLEKTLSNLALCEGVLERDVCVYLSCPRNEKEKVRTDAVLALVKRIKADKLPNIIIIPRDKNEGAGGNIRYAISETLKREEGRAIILEDDVLVSRTFLRYMDAALDFYAKDKRVWCINGHRQPYHDFPKSYPYDVYLNPRNMAWGWGVWRDRWENVDFSLRDWQAFKSSPENMRKLRNAGADMPAMLEKTSKAGIDTWDVQCSYYLVKQSLYCIESIHSQTKNIGFCREGSVNCNQPNGILAKQKYYNFMPRFVSVDEILEAEKPFWSFFKYNVSERRLIRYAWRRIVRYVLFYIGKENNSPEDC